MESPTGAVNYEFDDLGRLTRTYTGDIDPERASIAGDGKAITDTRYAYDALGRLLTVTSVEQFDTPILLGQATTYAYDARGLLDYLLLPSGIITDYTTDVMGRITDLVHYSPESGEPGDDAETFLDNGKLAEFHYTYLADGNRDSATETFYDAGAGASGGTTTIHWTYDALNRLTSEHYEGYDAAGEALSYLTSYTFDRVGNRLTVKRLAACCVPARNSSRALL
jgi:hypothetical protein